MKRYFLYLSLFTMLCPIFLLAQDIPVSQNLPTEEDLQIGMEMLDTFIEKLEATQLNKDGNYVIQIHEEDVGHNIILGAFYSATILHSDSRNSSGFLGYSDLDSRASTKKRAYQTLLDQFARDHQMNIETTLRWRTSVKDGVVDVKLNFDESFLDVTDQIDKTVHRRSFTGIMNGDLYQGSVGELHRPDSPASKALKGLITKFHSDPKFHTLFHATPVQIRRMRTVRGLRRIDRFLTKTFSRLVIATIGMGTLYYFGRKFYPDIFPSIMTIEYELPLDFFNNLKVMTVQTRDDLSVLSTENVNSFAFEREAEEGQ